MSGKNSVELLAEKLHIPFDISNTDYQQYLKWVADGNKPIPADEQGEQA
jgi:hypothetical protein